MCDCEAGILTAEVISWDGGSYSPVPKFAFPANVEKLGAELLPGDLYERIFSTEVNPLVAAGFIFQSCETLKRENPEVRNIEQFLLFQTYDFVTGPDFPARNMAPSDHPTWAEEILQDAEAAWDGVEHLLPVPKDSYAPIIAGVYQDWVRSHAALAALRFHTPFDALPEGLLERLEDAVGNLEDLWQQIFQGGMPEAWEDTIRDKFPALVTHYGISPH